MTELEARDWESGLQAPGSRLQLEVRPRRRFRAGGWLLVARSFLAALPALFSSAQQADRVDTTRAALEKLVETRRILSKERQEWALGRKLLQDRIELVRREIETLRERISDAEEGIAEAEKKRSDLAKEKERLEEVFQALAGTVISLEERTRELSRRLPDPIRERIKPLTQRIPENPDETKLRLAERFLTIVGILNEVDRFHGEITVLNELRTLADQTSAEVTSLYVGLGAAYSVTADGRAAGVGSPSAEGWVWTPADHAAVAIADAIAIFRGEKIAAFVRLPVRVQ